MRRQYRKGREGFTLVEALVGLAIGLVIGLIMTAVLRIALQSWERAEERRKAVETAQLVMGQLRQDFAALAVPSAVTQSWQGPVLTPTPAAVRNNPFYATPPDQPQSFLISDYPRYPRYYPGDNVGLGQEERIAVPVWDPDAIPPPGGTYDSGLDTGQRLMLIRRITPEDIRLNPTLRLAGNGLDDDGDGQVDEESFNLIDDDGDDRVDEDLAATGGLMAVTYILQRYEPTQAEKARREAESGLPEIPRYVLRRGVQSPVGGPLIAPAGGEGSDWKHWPILASDVLYFGLRFQAAAYGNPAVKDRTGDERVPGPSKYVYDDADTKPSDPSLSPYPASPETMWDSTRGIYDVLTSRRFEGIPLPTGIAPSSFAFYREGLAPATTSAIASLASAADDIFPRRVHVVLVLDAGPQLSPRGLLVGDVPAHAFRREGGPDRDLLPATTSASRGFAEGISAFSGSPTPLPVDEFREKQHLLLVSPVSYEWAHYRDVKRAQPYDAYMMDRTGQRATVSWKAFESRQTRVVSGMTFVSDIDVPSYRAPERGYGQ